MTLALTLPEPLNEKIIFVCVPRVLDVAAAWSVSQIVPMAVSANAVTSDGAGKPG